MGFRQGAYVKVWSIEHPGSDKYSKVRISSSRKNAEGKYEQDFGDFATMIGEANVKARSGLHEGDRIKLLSVDVTTRYDKPTKKQYTNFIVYDYEPAEQDAQRAPSSSGKVDSNPVESLPTDLPF